MTDSTPARGTTNAPEPDATHRIGAEGDGAWCLYLIECRNGSYYAGISNDPRKRYAAHVAGRGARYTRANPPLRLIGCRWFGDRSTAAKAEWRIRQLPRDRKQAFLVEDTPLP